MNLIFHDINGKVVDVYINDIVVNSNKEKGHLKCAFGVRAGKYLRFIMGVLHSMTKKNKAILLA